MIKTQRNAIAMSQIRSQLPSQGHSYLWDGYLDPGRITLLTSRWKTGKTTLLTGLMQGLEKGGEFLGQPLRPGKALVVSEEPQEIWAERLERMPIGPHARLISRPFPSRPSQAEWNDLIDDACLDRLDGNLDLFVIDSIAMFLPGHWESSAPVLIDALNPLRRLTDEGASVMLLHHPRRSKSEPGHSARGTGALLAFVDVALELNRYGRGDADARRRQIVALSRSLRTPERLIYEWDPASTAFTLVPDPLLRRFEDNWPRILSILQGRKKAATHHDLLMDWPEEENRPSATALYHWLNQAWTLKRLRRLGNGTRSDPYRYRLDNEDDWYYDRGELPPLENIGDILRERNT